MSDGPLHTQRGMAESFGADPERYDRVRPRYPDELISAIVNASPGADVLDVGTGTGIVARQLIAAGCRVTGVDVDERMAGFARAHGVTVEVAQFETWDAAGRSFDAVVAGQTWHWIDHEVGAAKAASVLRAGGLLALFWNVTTPPENVRHALSAVYREVLGGYDPWAVPMVAAYDRHLDEIATKLAADDAFGDPWRLRYDWARSCTTAEWLEQLESGGDAAAMPAGAMGRLRAGIGDALDGLGGTFAVDVAAMAVLARRGEDAAR